MPKHIRNIKGKSVDYFKTHLDAFLASVPDEPLIPGLTDMRRVDSNSVIDWVTSPYLRVQGTRRAHVSGERAAAQAVTA